MGSGSTGGSDTAGVGTWRYPSAAPFETMNRPLGQSCVASIGTSAANVSPSASGGDSGAQWLASDAAHRLDALAAADQVDQDDMRGAGRHDGGIRDETPLDRARRAEQI